jgi:hypothetical protein
MEEKRCSRLAPDVWHQDNTQNREGNEKAKKNGSGPAGKKNIDAPSTIESFLACIAKRDDPINVSTDSVQKMYTRHYTGGLCILRIEEEFRDRCDIQFTSISSS